MTSLAPNTPTTTTTTPTTALLAAAGDVSSLDDESSTSSRRKRSCSLTRTQAKKPMLDNASASEDDDIEDIDEDDDDDDDGDDDDDDESELGEASAAPSRPRVVPWAPHNATIAQHFVLLTQLSNTLRAEFACAQANMEKNRYANVLANEETRVKLASGAYVNANLCANGRFIATQAPLPDTLEDFWTMVLEQKSRVIVCLTKFEANRASNYMPELGRSTRVGRIAVHTRGAVQYGDDLIVRYLLVQHDADAAPRGVVHLQYTAWPDFGVPDSSEPVVRLYAIMRAFHSKLATSPDDDRAPFICHCSAGIGRAGTFIAASTLIEQVADGSLQATPSPSSPPSSSSSSAAAAAAAAPPLEHCDSTTMRAILAHRAFVDSVVSSIDVTATVDPALLGDVPSSPSCTSSCSGSGAGGVACCSAPAPAVSPPTITITTAATNESTTDANHNNLTPAPFAEWARGASISPPSSPPPQQQQQQQQQPTSFLSQNNARRSPPVESTSEAPSPQLLSAVFQTVLNLRKARRGCVQTCAQYQYIVTLVNSLTQHVAALRMSLCPSSSSTSSSPVQPTSPPPVQQSNAAGTTTSHITVL